MKVSEIREVLLQYSTLNENIKSYCDKLEHIDFNINGLTIDGKVITNKNKLDKLLATELNKEQIVSSVYNTIINVKDLYFELDNKVSNKTKEVKEKMTQGFFKSRKKIDIFLAIGVVLLIILIGFAIFAGIYQIKNEGNQNPWYVWVMVIVGMIGSAADVAGIFFTIREIRDDKLKEKTGIIDSIGDEIMSQFKNDNNKDKEDRSIHHNKVNHGNQSTGNNSTNTINNY